MNEIRVTSALEASSEGTATSVRLAAGDTLSAEVVGLVHTHPSLFPHPSDADLRADQVFVSTLANGCGLFGIFSDALRWFLLRADDRHYTPIDVVEV
jgi:hypothetical protein